MGPITRAMEPAAAVSIAGRPPSADITRPNTMDETSATLGSTPLMNENEITSGISASAVTRPASVSRTSPPGERSTEPTEGVSSKLASAGAVVIVMKKGLRAAQVCC